MLRTIHIYGLILAALAVGLQWLEFRFLVMSHATETYVAMVALAFLGLGVWAGARLFRQASPPAEFTPNTVAGGQSNKEIARELEVSPNTVKTHVASLLNKLHAESRAHLAAMAARSGVVAEGAAAGR